VIDKILQRLGNVKKAYVTGDIASGKDIRIIDLVLIGDDINQNYLNKLIDKVEKLIHRKIRCFILTNNEEKSYMKHYPEALVIWTFNNK